MPNQQTTNICPLCKENSNFHFLRDYENFNKQFSLYQCLTCGGQFWLPFKNPGSEWYEKHDNHNIKVDYRPRQIHSYHKYFLSLEYDLKNKKVLDLGCGTGEFIAELNKLEADVYGVDIDRDSVTIAKNYFNLKNIYALSITDFFNSVKLPKFNYITAFEVFEHIDDPYNLLREAINLLNDNGKIVLSIPSRDRPLVNLSSWDYPYHHLSRWDKKSIIYMLMLFNFKNIKIKYINKFHQLYELFLELIAKKLKFSKASKLKKISEEKISIKKSLIKFVYKIGRFIGVILVPYTMTLCFYPFSLFFYPKAGIMYIEATKK